MCSSRVLFCSYLDTSGDSSWVLDELESDNSPAFPFYQETHPWRCYRHRFAHMNCYAVHPNSLILSTQKRDSTVGWVLVFNEVSPSNSSSIPGTMWGPLNPTRSEHRARSKLKYQKQTPPPKKKQRLNEISGQERVKDGHDIQGLIGH